MATDEERREVARRLRDVAERSRAWTGLTAQRDGAWYLRLLCAIADAAGTRYGGYEFDPDELSLRLADLVEPSGDNDALLALADEIERDADAARDQYVRLSEREAAGESIAYRDCARRIREACGVVER